MTDKNSVRITAMSLARRRALAGVRTGATPSGRQTIGDVIVFGNRRTLIPGSRRERLTQNGVAGKWRRNGLKRLNPGREMVWARKRRTHNIWYPGARLTARLRVTSCEKDKLPNSRAARDPVSPPRSSVYECRRSARSRHARVMAQARPRGKFSALQRLENARNWKRISIFARGPFDGPAERLAEEAARSAPLAIRVLDPARGSTNAVGRLGRATLAWAGKTEREIFRLAKP